MDIKSSNVTCVGAEEVVLAVVVLLVLVQEKEVLSVVMLLVVLQEKEVLLSVVVLLVMCCPCLPGCYNQQ